MGEACRERSGMDVSGLGGCPALLGDLRADGDPPGNDGVDVELGREIQAMRAQLERGAREIAALRGARAASRERHRPALLAKFRAKQRR